MKNKDMLNYRFNCTFHKQVTSCEQDCCIAEKYFANSLKNKQVLKQHYSGLSWRTWTSKLLVCRIFWHKLEILLFSYLWFQLLNKWLPLIQLSSFLLKFRQQTYIVWAFILRDYIKFGITTVVITWTLARTF